MFIMFLPVVLAAVFLSLAPSFGPQDIGACRQSQFAGLPQVLVLQLQLARLSQYQRRVSPHLPPHHSTVVQQVLCVPFSSVDPARFLQPDCVGRRAGQKVGVAEEAGPGGGTEITAQQGRASSQ